jgi:hypothetical protein
LNWALTQLSWWAEKWTSKPKPKWALEPKPPKWVFFLEAAEVGLGVAVLDVRWCLFLLAENP